MLDTVGLSVAAGRTTAKDTTMIERLERVLSVSQSHRQLVFDSVQKAKFNVSGNRWQCLLTFCQL